MKQRTKLTHAEMVALRHRNETRASQMTAQAPLAFPEDMPIEEIEAALNSEQTTVREEVTEEQVAADLAAIEREQE